MTLIFAHMQTAFVFNILIANHFASLVLASHLRVVLVVLFRVLDKPGVLNNCKEQELLKVLKVLKVFASSRSYLLKGTSYFKVVLQLT